MIKAYAFFLTYILGSFAVPVAYAQDGEAQGLLSEEHVEEVLQDVGHAAHDVEVDMEAAAHQMVEGAHHAESAGLPQLDPTYYASQIFWLIVVFVFMYFFFARSILPTLSAIIDNRHKHIHDDLDMAQSLKEEAEEVQASYEDKLHEARDKATALYAEIENEIGKKTEKSLHEFQEEYAKQVAVTEAKLIKAKKEAMEEMNSIAAEIASIAAKKIVGVSTDPAKAQDIVKDLSKAKAA